MTLLHMKEDLSKNIKNIEKLSNKLKEKINYSNLYYILNHYDNNYYSEIPNSCLTDLIRYTFVKNCDISKLKYIDLSDVNANYFMV